jgi:iron(III) transport system substrate-binding protein
VRRTSTSPVARLIVLAAAAAALAFAAATAASGATRASGAAPATAKQWKAIIAKAKQEGSVTLYSSQAPAGLQLLADAFKKKYGITVTFNRNIDSVLTTQLGTEESANHLNADVFVVASRPVVLGVLKHGWATDAVGPDLFAKEFDRTRFAKPGKAVVVGAAVLGLAWNTSQFPQGLKNLKDLLNPTLKGRVGVIVPGTAPSLVDWWHWAQQTQGSSYLSQLAAQDPKFYPSSIPMTQAVASGEIAAASFASTTAVTLKQQGAPIGFIPYAWNAPWWGMVLKNAPHPDAAQLLMDYIVTKEGQATSEYVEGAVLKNVPNTYFVTPRVQPLNQLTPPKIAAFDSSWSATFHH